MKCEILTNLYLFYVAVKSRITIIFQCNIIFMPHTTAKQHERQTW